MFFEKVYLIGVKDEVVLLMKGGILFYILFIVIFVVCLYINKDVFNIFYFRRFCYCGFYRRGK